MATALAIYMGVSLLLGSRVHVEPGIVGTAVFIETVRLHIQEGQATMPQTNTYRAVRVCVAFETPLYIGRARTRNASSPVARLVQADIASDLELSGIASLCCPSGVRSNISGIQSASLHHSMVTCKWVPVVPTPRNLTDPLSALFRASYSCPESLMRRSHSFAGLVHLGHQIDGERRETRLLENELKTCRLYFAGSNDKFDFLHADGSKAKHSFTLTQPAHKTPIDVYHYGQPQCSTTDTNSELTLVELEDQAKAYGLLTASTAARIQPVFEMIFTPVLNSIMKPVLNAVVSRFAPDLLETLNEVLQHSVNSQVPGDVAAMVGSSVTANVTNLLADSITAHVSSVLTGSLTADLGLYLKDTVSEAVLPRLEASLMESLVQSIPAQVNRLLPEVLSRSLLPSLTGLLTRTLTHSLTHTLALGVTQGGIQKQHQADACQMCYYQGMHCVACHSSPVSLYYTNYYATYYADYFSEYYAKYYVSAVEAVDEVQHTIASELGDEKKK